MLVSVAFAVPLAALRAAVAIPRTPAPRACTSGPPDFARVEMEAYWEGKKSRLLAEQESALAKVAELEAREQLYFESTKAAKAELAALGGTAPAAAPVAKIAQLAATEAVVSPEASEEIGAYAPAYATSGTREPESPQLCSSEADEGASGAGIGGSGGRRSSGGASSSSSCGGGGGGGEVCSGSGSLYGDGGPSSGRKKRDTMKTNLLGGAPLSTAAEHQEETELHPVNR